MREMIGGMRCAILVLLAPMVSMGAELVVHEPFNYSLSDGEQMAGQTIGATGLTGRFMTLGANAVFSSKSLELGPKIFPSAGGAVLLFSTPEDPNKRGGLLRMKLEAVSPRGNLWASYLFQIHNGLGDKSASMGICLTDGTNRWFYIAGNMRETRGDGKYEPRPGVRYSGGSPWGGPEPYSIGGANPAELSLVPETTYLAIAKFSNVGSEVSETSPGEARLWVLDRPAYEEWRTKGGSREDTLDTYAVWIGSHVSPDDKTSDGQPRSEQFKSPGGLFSLDSEGACLELHAYDGNAEMSATIDEIRWGDSLESVAVPQ